MSMGIVSASINDKNQYANTDHTTKFAKLANEYAALYDRWHGLVSDARRARETASRQEAEAEKLWEEIRAKAAAMADHTLASGKRGE